jgi:hypothetical protein
MKAPAPLILFAVASLALTSSVPSQSKPTPPESLQWTNNDGISINAHFVQFYGEAVLLRTEDGKTYKVPFTRLSTDSVARARKSGEMAHSVELSNKQSRSDLKKADKLARDTAAWFHYTTGKMDSDKLGQCGDYAVMFILKYNAYAGKNVARLVVANNPIPSGTYRLGEKADVAKLGFNGFQSGASGFLIWNGKQYIYHPVLGAYEIFIEKAWTPKRHFGVDMLDKKQVHVWATIGDVSVDPTYFDSGNYPSPLGTDE